MSSKTVYQSDDGPVMTMSLKEYHKMVKELNYLRVEVKKLESQLNGS